MKGGSERKRNRERERGGEERRGERETWSSPAKRGTNAERMVSGETAVLRQRCFSLFLSPFWHYFRFVEELRVCERSSSSLSMPPMDSSMPMIWSMSFFCRISSTLILATYSSTESDSSKD